MKPQFTSKDVKIISKETLFQGFFQMVKYTFKHKLFDGGWSQPVERELFERGHAAAMLPYDPIRDEVVLIEQIRVGALEHESPWQLEIVAGIMDADEETEELVRREAMEEAGLEVKNIASVASYYPSAGGCSEKLDVFVGQVSSLGAGGVYGLEYENEDIRALVMNRSDAYALIAEGKIENGASIVALQWLELNHEKLRTEWLP
ncbi:ADP-ribose diphosphatase [Vibrio sp. DW001]|uniref:ADP-ribose diphosphatase n=1 Tax=Vibrio sp. DW001 TaxID=2912315 RepID=UPI0023AE8107|nr:ADP-ribose diphosphatase [Vibrio sp. DW001]WED26249.1 ADP-ribose diphosphatase [Vibrio sp. DW001]